MTPDDFPDDLSKRTARPAASTSPLALAIVKPESAIVDATEEKLTAEADKEQKAESAYNRILLGGMFGGFLGGGALTCATHFFCPILGLVTGPLTLLSLAHSMSLMHKLPKKDARENLAEYKKNKREMAERASQEDYAAKVTAAAQPLFAVLAAEAEAKPGKSILFKSPVEADKMLALRLTEIVSYTRPTKDAPGAIADKRQRISARVYELPAAGGIAKSRQIEGVFLHHDRAEPTVLDKALGSIGKSAASSPNPQ